MPWVRHSREEGSLDYDGRHVRLQVYLNFNTNIYHQQPWRRNPSRSSAANQWVIGPRDERPTFQDSVKPRRASSLKNKHLGNLLLEHAGAPRAAAPPCAGVASAASPPRAGAAAPPPSPASLMARLMPYACLRKENLLDSLLGNQRRWWWSFLGAAVDEVLGWPGFILTSRWTVRRSVTRLGTRFRWGELLATKIMWSQEDVWLFIFYS
jgi:hypothetical protein